MAQEKHYSDEFVNAMIPIISAANALKDHYSIVEIVRKEAGKINDLGYTSTSARLFEAAKKLDALFAALDKVE